MSSARELLLEEDRDSPPDFVPFRPVEQQRPKPPTRSAEKEASPRGNPTTNEGRRSPSPVVDSSGAVGRADESPVITDFQTDVASTPVTGRVVRDGDAMTDDIYLV